MAEDIMNVEDNTSIDVSFMHANNSENTYAQIQECIKAYVSACNKVIKDLKAMLDPIAKFQSATNVKRTFATGTGVASTVLTVTGVALAGPTFGASLNLTGLGIVAGIGAGLKCGFTEYNDYYKTKDFICEIQEILKKLEDPGKALDDMLKEIKLFAMEMTKLGYTEQDAITRALIGIAKGAVDVGRIGQSATTLVVSKVTIQAVPNIAESSASAGCQVLTKAADEVILSSFEAVSAGGKALQSTSGVMIGLTVGFGVAFTVVDIVLLVNVWSKKHKTAEAIEKLIKEIKDEIDQWEKFSSNMLDIITSGQICILYQQIQNMAREYVRRERQIREEFEEWKRQVKQEAEERERQTKQEFEERESRMEAKQNEMEAKQNEMEEELAKIKAFISNNNNKQ